MARRLRSFWASSRTLSIWPAASGVIANGKSLMVRACVLAGPGVRRRTTYIPPAKCGSDGYFARRPASGRKYPGRLGLHGRPAMRSTADLTGVIRHLRAPAGDGPGDPELLDRYTHGH